MPGSPLSRAIGHKRNRVHLKAHCYKVLLYADTDSMHGLLGQVLLCVLTGLNQQCHLGPICFLWQLLNDGASQCCITGVEGFYCKQRTLRVQAASTGCVVHDRYIWLTTPLSTHTLPHAAGRMSWSLRWLWGIQVACLQCAELHNHKTCWFDIIYPGVTVTIGPRPAFGCCGRAYHALSKL